MATKSFTSELKFNRKSVDNLLKALEKDSKANIVKVKSSNVSNVEDIRKMFVRK
ncbi:MAG: hypothetical protein HXL14_06995 [Parvimonas sp.]|nr:hypothetical protein [Parvimonas sp.]